MQKMNAIDREEDSLEGKRCLVTGGTTGIGRAIAIALADAGAEVMIIGRHEAELNDALQALGSHGKGMVADVTHENAIHRVFEGVDELLGGLDVLVNNAGTDAGSVKDLEYQDIQEAVQTNVTGYLACAHEALKRMDGKGDIVNIGSMSADERGGDGDVYVATKGAVRTFSDSLRQSTAKTEVRVSLIEPGLVGTDMIEQGPEEQRKLQAEGKMLKAEDIADCVTYILTRPRRLDIHHVKLSHHHPEV